MNISNIDVTLRDGGYRNQFSFSEDYAKLHVQMMVKAGVEWIEIGYRNGSFKPIVGIGETGLSPDHYIQTLRAVTDHPGICVMLHPKNVAEHELSHMRKLGVDMLRFCADQQKFPLTLDYVRAAKALGYTVCVNLTRISQMRPRDLTHQAEKVADAGADVVYLADSNGSMTPERVKRLFTTIQDVSQCKVGFHAHDNLGLAMSNSIAALNAGASFIDSSLRGMGKGAGNLKLELWLAFLRRERAIEKYNYAALLDQVDILENTDQRARPTQPLDDLIMGLYDLSVDHRERLHANANRVSDMLANAVA